MDCKVVGRLQRLCALRQRLLDVTNIAGDVVLVDLGRADVLVELLLLGQALPFRPRRLEVLRRLDRAPFGFGDDAQEIAFAAECGTDDKRVGVGASSRDLICYVSESRTRGGVAK